MGRQATSVRRRQREEEKEDLYDVCQRTTKMDECEYTYNLFNMYAQMWSIARGVKYSNSTTVILGISLLVLND